MVKRLIALFVSVGVLLGFLFISIEVSAQTTKTITRIKIGGSRVELPWYALAEAWAYYINHSSSWLQASVVATPGLGGNADLMADKPKEYAGMGDGTNLVFRMIPPSEAAKIDPFMGYTLYDKMRFIGNATGQIYAWVTYDKNIKAIKDFVGKRVGVRRKGAIGAFEELAILKKAGVLDKVKVIRGGFGAHVENMKAGQVDVIHTIIDPILPTTFIKGALITDLETMGSVYYISDDLEVLREVSKDGHLPGAPIRIPPGALDAKRQLTEIWSYFIPTFFAADERMDDEIVYELTRIIWETAGKWDKWHAQGANVTHKFIPGVLDMKYVHPGTKNFFDKHGVKLVPLETLLR